MEDLLKNIRSLSKLRAAAPFSRVAEIRLRSGRPAVCVDISGKMSVCSDIFTAREISEVFSEICGYSVFSHEQSIANGFVALNGGHRAGVAGVCVYKNGSLETIRDVSGINIRVAHEAKGCANLLYERFFADRARSLLIVGAPMSGKTTLLRDLARRLGERFRVTVIDTRSEISACYKGQPQFDIGLHTDVLCGCEKADGMIPAIRALNPEILICDEIFRDADIFRETARCGVKLVASAHSDSIDEVLKRPDVAKISDIFEGAACVEKMRIKELREL